MRRALILCILISVIPFAIMAQVPEIGRIAIYADSLRTTSEVDVLAPYTLFDVYIFCQPSMNGMYCAEFAMHSSTESMVIANQEWHENISVILGNLASGVSTCFLDCQAEWVCLVHLSMLNTTTDPAVLEIVRHPDVGYYQFANCLEDSQIEPIFIGPKLCFNQTCAPDTDPPVPVSIEVEDDIHLALGFDEAVFEPDATDPASYRIYRTDGIPDTIPVNLVLLEDSEDRVWMVLGGLLGEAPYTLEVDGVRDVTGNPSAPGPGIAFTGVDTSPPELLQGFYMPAINSIALIFSEVLDEASAADISNYSVVCHECTVTPLPYVAFFQADGMTVHLRLYGQVVPDVTYEVWVEGIADDSGNVMAGTEIVSFTAADCPPYVSEISLVTDMALDIVWSKDLEQTSAEDISNYTFSRNGPPAEPMNLISAGLNGGRTVRLDFSPAIEQEEAYTLLISGVMDTSGLYMHPGSFSFVPLDTIPPYMISAECNGLMHIELIFSEAIDDYVGGHTEYFQVFPAESPEEPVALSGVALYGSGLLVRLYLAEELTAGVEYTVRAIGISDVAGNIAPLLQRTVICNDIYPPEVLEIFLPDFTRLNIRFNEMVNEAAEDPASYLLYLAADSTATMGIDSVRMHDTGLRAELHLTTPLSLGEMYTLRMIGIGDMAGNMIDPDSSWSFQARDNITPSLINLTVTSDSIVHLEFDEQLNPATAEDVTKYAVVEATDTSVQLPLQSADLDAGGTMVDLEIEGGAPVGTAYKVLIRGVTDPSGNALYAESEDFEFIDDIPPHLLNAESPSARNVIVYFDEMVTRATAQDENNYALHVEGTPASGIDVLDAERLPDQMSVNLVLGDDMTQHVFYRLMVSGINDLAENTMAPDSADFQYIDDTPPVILDVDLVQLMKLVITFDEPVDSVTAVDMGNFLVYLSSDASQQIAVNSIDWISDEVTLNLAVEPIANVDYTVRVDGVEDRVGNACSELEETFRNFVYVPPAKMYLYSDENRTSNEVDADVLYEPFSIYVFVEAGDNGVFAVDYALSAPETYLMTALTHNPEWVAASQGNPYDGHSVTLSMCAQDWLWITHIECMCFEPDVQEIVWIRPHPVAGKILVASCLPGHPLEAVTHTNTLLINVTYVGVMIDSWEASFRNGCVELNWSIVETEAVPAFEVSRALDGLDTWRQLDDDLIFGDGLRFTLVDSDLEFGSSYRYRVECIDEDGRRVLFETAAVSTPVMPLALRQNSPNPFNPSTSIGFFLPQPGHVRLEIFDVNGRQINVLADGHYASGEHSVDWDGRDRSGTNVTSGVYFYRLIAGKESLSRKMVLLR